MARYLLIHDTTTIGHIIGAVYTRLLKRQGHDVELDYGIEKTKRAKDFWRGDSAYVDKLDLTEFDHLVLCCISFDDSAKEECIGKLKDLHKKLGKQPIILSHRWPNGYERAGYETQMIPVDLINGYADKLEPSERELLRLTLVVNRQADRKLVSNSDFDLSERLGTVIWADRLNWRKEKSYPKLLVDDPAEVLRNLRINPSLGKEIFSNSNFFESDEPYPKYRFVLFNLKPELESHMEKIIEQLLEKQIPKDKLDRTIGLGILIRNDGIPRAYIVRPWGSKPPSIKFLLEQYNKKEPSSLIRKPEDWFGEQNAKSFNFERAKLNADDLPNFKHELISFAKWATTFTEGETDPIKTLSHLIHASASMALSSLDLRRLYTDPKYPNLIFDPDKAKILTQKGNRTGKSRETLVLKLKAKTAKAAAFLFKHGGYNLLKLERLLEGVLIGFQSQLQWLSLSVPSRLRIDVSLAETATKELDKELSNAPEVSIFPLAEALEKGLIGTDSSIAKAMSKFYKNETSNPNLVLYMESETIGPSVQYALTARALASELSEEKEDQKLEVLDLFSGSGLLARAFLNVGKPWQVFSIDMTTRARDMGFKHQNKVIWLNADVSAVIAGDGKGIIERDFDLACLDPPHSLLFELLFCSRGDNTLLEKVAAIAEWIIIYQGHTSQEGRGKALEIVLKKPKMILRGSNSNTCVASVTVSSEVMTIVGPKKWKNVEFEKIIKRLQKKLQLEADEFNWEVSVKLHFDETDNV